MLLTRVSRPLKSELIKMWTVGTALWTTVIAIVIALAFAIVNGWSISWGAEFAKGNDGEINPEIQAMLEPTVMIVSSVGIAVLVLTVMAILSVTNEFSTKTILASYRADPHRWPIFSSKLFINAVYSVVIAELLIVPCLFLTRLFLGEYKEFLSLNVDARVFIALPVYVLFYMLFGMGIALLLRSSAAAVTVFLVWVVVIEAFIGGALQKVAVWLPSTAMGNFFEGDDSSLEASSIRHLSYDWSGLYALAIAVAIFLAGVFFNMKRSAR